MAGLDVREWKFARVDTVEPFVVVAFGLAYAHGCLVILEQARRVRLPRTAVDPDGPFRPVKNRAPAPFGNGSMDNLNPVFVKEPNLLFSVFWGDDLDRTGEVRVHAPLSDVEVMSSHVSEIPVAILSISAPAGEMVMNVVRAKSLVVSAGRSRALPGIPVNPLGYFFGREIAWFWWASHAYADFLDLPDRPLRMSSTVLRNLPPNSVRC